MSDSEELSSTEGEEPELNIAVKWKAYFDKYQRDFKEPSLSPKSVPAETDKFDLEFDYIGRASEIKHHLYTDTMDWYFSAAPEIKRSKNIVELYNKNFMKLVQQVVFQPNAKKSNKHLREAIKELLEESIAEQHILNYLKYGIFTIKYSKYICNTYGGECLELQTGK